MIEEWRDIPGYDGKYKASSYGRILSFAKGRRTELAFCLDSKRRYFTVRLWAKGKGPTCKVHRLIALAFLGPCPKGYEVSHIDHDIANNHINNLEYATHRDNMLHSLEDGRLALSLQCLNLAPNGRKLSPEQVIEIRRKLAEGEACKSIANEYGVCTRTIERIRSGHIHRHVNTSAVDKAAAR